MNTIKSVLSLVIFSIFIFNSLITASTDQPLIEHQIITTPHNNESIELYLLKPKGEGPFPVIFLLHGYQAPENNIGGKQLVDYGYLERFVNQGIVAVSISMPGYGKSTGLRDFGGSNSQKAIISTIEQITNLPFVDSSRIGIYGISRGAQLAGMVTSFYPAMSIQILESGFYDLVSFQTDVPDYLSGITTSLIQEGGNTIDELIARSPVYHTKNVKASTLILQGEFDDRRQLPSAQKLQQQLLDQERECLLKIYQGELHALPQDKWDTIIPFIRERFFDLFGIGIKVSEATPAMQILKIHPNSQAEKVQKFKVGDAILSISPMNDNNVVSTIKMPISQFISLVLGKRDTYLRIRVQHFDLSIEDIVVKRG